MKTLGKLMAIFDSFNWVLSILGSIVLVFLMIAVALEVSLRFSVNVAMSWVPEISEYCLLFITFLGGAWVLKKERHVIIDMVPNQLSPKAQSILNFFTSLLCTLICPILTWYGGRVTLEAYELGYYYSTPLETPKFIVLGIIPVGCFLLFIQFIRRTYGFYTSWRSFADKGKA